jgi:hypothetical protein
LQSAQYTVPTDPIGEIACLHDEKVYGKENKMAEECGDKMRRRNKNGERPSHMARISVTDGVPGKFAGNVAMTSFLHSTIMI